MEPADLAFAGIARQRELLDRGEITASEFLECYLERIQRIDPALGAFTKVFTARARAEAQQADARRAAGDKSRALLGIPIAVKDDTDVTGAITGYGSRAHGAPATHDAPVVAHLRAAGAIVIGKTAVPELMMFPFTESEATGATRNPWNVKHTPGGSSGGSASAVAAGLVGAALGSDGGGSIRIPAACCGLFGIKPQRGRVAAQHSVSKGWHGLGVLGPLTRSVADAALLLDVIADSGTTYSDAAAKAPGKLRIAVSRKLPAGVFAPLTRELDAALSDTATHLRELGHEVIERDPDYGLVMPGFLARYFGGIRDEAGALTHHDLLEHRTRTMARAGSLVRVPMLRRVDAREAQAAARIFAIFDHCDVLLTPTIAKPPPRVGRWEHRDALRTLYGVARFTPYTGVWNHLGNPAASVPATPGAKGLPRAAQLVGRPDDEATLISLSAQLEQIAPWSERRPEIAA